MKSSEIPQLHIEPDRAALARYGLDMDDFQHALQAALGGQPVGVFWEREARFDIVLRYPITARDDIEKIRKLRIAASRAASRCRSRCWRASISATVAPRSAARTDTATSACA